jgi:hypothetical protein
MESICGDARASALRASAVQENARALAAHARELLDWDLEEAKGAKEEGITKLRAHVDAWERAVIHAAEQTLVAVDAVLEQLEQLELNPSARETLHDTNLNFNLERPLEAATTPLHFLRTLISSASTRAALVSDNAALQAEFRRVIETGDCDVVALLLEDGRADPAANHSESLVIACIPGNTDLVALLLKDGRADPAADESGALVEAAIKGHTHVVERLLLDGRADPGVNGSYALREASARGHVDVVSLLLENERSDPGAEDSDALTQACLRGHAHVVARLLQDGRANPAARDSLCMKLARMNYHTQVVALLEQDGRARTFVYV